MPTLEFYTSSAVGLLHTVIWSDTDTHQAYSAATDFILALLPWAMLWNLNMKNKEKFGVAVAMSLGVL